MPTFPQSFPFLFSGLLPVLIYLFLRNYNIVDQGSIRKSP